MNYKILPFLEKPHLMVQNIGWLQWFYFLFMFSGFCIVAYYIWKKIVRPEQFWSVLEQENRNGKPAFFIATIFCLVLLGVGMRGGLQQIPINPSTAFHHVKFDYNYAALNSVFNLMYNVYENREVLHTNPYKMLPDDEAAQRVQSLYSISKDTCVKIFNLPRQNPNVVFIVMEGINANALQHHGAAKSYMPYLDSLIKQGLYFDACYATGFRTDQGLPALLSGYPSQPHTSIVTQINKLQHLPTITSYFHKRKYQSLFCFGGEPEFGNIKSYLIHNKFKRITAIEDFPFVARTQQLGVPDEIVLDTFLNQLNRFRKPFFAMCLTQSTHEPYDIPCNKWTLSDEKRYAHACRYLDSSLQHFMEKAKHQKWFKQTIWIITADHAHIHPYNYEPGSLERFHIPFLILSPYLKPMYIDTSMHPVIDQTDIPMTLLRQLNYRPVGFKWSKNYFNPYQQKFTFSTFINGHIFKNDTSLTGFEYRFMKWKDVPDSSMNETKYGMSMLQRIMQEYLAY